MRREHAASLGRDGHDSRVVTGAITSWREDTNVQTRLINAFYYHLILGTNKLVLEESENRCIASVCIYSRLLFSTSSKRYLPI